jgi:hypothetical protein
MAGARQPGRDPAADRAGSKNADVHRQANGREGCRNASGR